MNGLRPLFVAAVAVLLVAIATSADEKKDSPNPPKTDAPKKAIRQLTPSLSVDPENHRVTLDAVIVLREGPLELLLCPRETKEHESIMAADVEPKTFQLALLLAGFRPGRPAQFSPYEPPEGDHVAIKVEYEEDGARRVVDARSWIRDMKTGKATTADFVFAGSGFRTIPGTTQSIFLGDEGDLVCVANFPGAVLDVSQRSSKENAELVFDAFTPKIPPLKTKVKVIFERAPSAKPKS